MHVEQHVGGIYSIGFMEHGSFLDFEKAVVVSLFPLVGNIWMHLKGCNKIFGRDDSPALHVKHREAARQSSLLQSSQIISRGNADYPSDLCQE